MFETKTTFIVGAGAGVDIQMPLGTELKDTIARQLNLRTDDFGRRLLSGDQSILDVIRHNPNQLDDLGITSKDVDQAIKSIRASLHQAISIDNYLDNHSNDAATVFLGKLAIVNAIAKAERKSSVYFEIQSTDSNIDPNKIEPTWYNFLFKKICENNNSIEQLEETLANLSFIIFNYDRCLEHFLFQSIKTYWRLDDEKTAGLLRKTRFYHPYGSLGELQWQNYNRKFAFGGNVSTEFLLTAYSKIKTFTEQVKEGTLINMIRSVMQETETMIFLGFAFYDQNIRLLSPEQEAQVKKIFGTAIGISQWDLEDVDKELLTSLKLQGRRPVHNINPELDCVGLFEKNWRILGKPL